jgi:excisionase family DNA binding protein
MLHVSYSGLKGNVLRYHCRGAQVNHGEDWCISFGGMRVDQAIADEVLNAIGGNAIQAALEAAETKTRQRAQEREAMLSEIEQADYEVRLATRRYEAVDPENRLVAAELEARWNSAIQRLHDLQRNLQRFDAEKEQEIVPDKKVLLSLAQDLPAVWNSPTADMRVKQRIVRILIHEIIVDVDDARQEIILMIHWTGGRHSELHVKKNLTGKHGRCTSIKAVEVIRSMAGKYPDEQIAATLNRLGLRTGHGNSWSQMRVYWARHYHRLPAYDPKQASTTVLTLEKAARHLGVSSTTVRRLIENKIIPAYQVVPRAPWEIPAETLDSEAIREEIQKVVNRVYKQRTQTTDQRPLFEECNIKD